MFKTHVFVILIGGQKGYVHIYMCVYACMNVCTDMYIHMYMHAHKQTIIYTVQMEAAGSMYRKRRKEETGPETQRQPGSGRPAGGGFGRMGGCRMPDMDHVNITSHTDFPKLTALSGQEPDKKGEATFKRHALTYPKFIRHFHLLYLPQASSASLPNPARNPSSSHHLKSQQH